VLGDQAQRPALAHARDQDRRVRPGQGGRAVDRAPRAQVAPVERRGVAAPHLLHQPERLLEHLGVRGAAGVGLDQVVGHPHGVHAGLLGGTGDAGELAADPGRAAGPGVVGDAEADAHLGVPSSIPGQTRSIRGPTRVTAGTG
jgi:hypothetical protein